VLTDKISLKKYLKYYYLDILLILIIPLLSLWGFLFIPGYYFYADQSWPLSKYVYSNAILSLNSLDGFSFSRLIVGWPYYIITLFTNSVEITERIFIYYTFVLYTFFAYVLASMITSRLLKTRNKYEIKLIKFIIVLFIFSNFTALNLNADGGSFADGLNIIFIAMILFTFIAWKNMRLAFLLSSILLTVSVLVEPDYTTFFIISIFLGSAISGVLNRDFVYRVKYALLSIFSIIIPILFILFGMDITSNTISSISSLGALRVYNYGTIAFFSGNIKPLYPLILIGHLWSTIVYAPPNILLYGNRISSIKALMYPSQLLLPPGFITDLWLFALIMIPILSLASIIFKETRKIAFPVIILFLVFYAMSLVYYIKPLYDFEYYLSSLPLIGGSIGTTLSLPGHIINVIAGMYYILFSITLIELFNRSKSFFLQIKYDKADKDFENTNKSNIFIKNIFIDNKNIKIAIVIFITFIILLSGWQAFDGTFYPARAPEVPYGNGVANIGAFTPVAINESVLKAYDLISSQKQNFNIIWIGGPEYSERPYGYAHPGANLPDLPFIVQNNMKDAFYYDLLADNVKYIVISNQDIQKNASGIFVMYTFSSAGFNNFTDAQNFMSSINGLIKVYSENQVDVFEVKNFSAMYKSNLLINYSGSSPYMDSLPSLFASLGYNVSITNIAGYGIPFSINNGVGNSIYTPVNITNFIESNNYKFYNLSSNINITGAGHNGPVGLPDNYTLALWSNDEVYYNYSNDVINVHMTNDTNYGTSISYNGSFIGGAGGFYDNNQYVNMTVTFKAKSTYPGKDLILFMGEPKKDPNTDNIYTAKYFNVTKTYETYTFSYIFPSTEKYIDFRIYNNFPGIFYIKNLSTEYKILPSIIDNSSLPFGNFMCLNNTILHGNNRTALIYMKSDNMNNYEWIKFNFRNGLHIKNYTNIAALILLNNDTILNNENKSYIVSIYPSDREYELEYNHKFYKSIPGIYENSIYIINSNIGSLNNAKIIAKGEVLMDVFYIGIIFYLIVLIYYMIDIYRRNRGNF